MISWHGIKIILKALNLFFIRDSLYFAFYNIAVIQIDTIFIVPDRWGYPQNSFLISPQNMLWYSLEAPRLGASNEYPQYMFSWRNKKKHQCFSIEKSTSSRDGYLIYLHSYYHYFEL